MKTRALGFVIAVALAGPSFAQQTSPPFPLSHPHVRMSDPSVRTLTDSAIGKMSTKRRQQLMQDIAARETWDRVDRALRVAALVDSGRCIQAEELAEAENDHPMAMRARFVCVNNGLSR